MKEFSEDPLAFLVEPESKSTFLRDAWEKKAALYSANKHAPRSQLKDVLDMKHVCSVLDTKEDEGQCLRFGIDCCAMAYLDGERSDLGGTMGELLDSEEAQALYSAGATLQVHQPQRFSTMLWKLCAALETQLGCLVGCNAYITPADAQGLAPHWDDVSIFALQTAGSKSWKVYGPMEDCELPSASSGDIARGTLPAPVLEVTLKEGREPCPEAPLDLRSGLPIGFVFSQSLSSKALTASKETEKDCAAAQPQEPFNSTAESKGAASNLAGALRKMADVIDEHPQATNTAAQAQGLAFMRDRLPPHPDQLPESGKAPTLNSLVCCRKEGAFVLTSDDAREWMRSDQDPALNSASSGEEEDDQELDAAMLGAEESSEEDAEMNDREEQGKETEAKSACGASAGATVTAKGGQKNAAMNKAGDNLKAGKGGAGKDGHATGKGCVELDGAAEESSDEEGGDSEGHNDDSDVAIDDDVLGNDLEEFVVLATCLYNDRSMHMVDPKLVAAAQAGALGRMAASKDEDESEGDEPPYDLVPMKAEPGADGKGCKVAAKATGEGKKCLASSGDLLDAKPSGCYVQGVCQRPKADEERMPWMLDIPVWQGLAAAKLLECVNGKSIRVSSLPLEHDQDKLELVLALHQWGALCTLPDEKKQAKKAQQGPKVASQGTMKKTAAGKQKHNGTAQKGFGTVVPHEKGNGASEKNKKNKKKKGKAAAQ